MQTTLVLGKGGYLGERIFQSIGEEAVFSEVDMIDLSALEEEISRLRPRRVVNAAGYAQTAEAEKPEHRNLAFQLNVQGPANLVYLAHRYGFYLVHISTGMFFDGAGPTGNGWKEDDTPQPTNYYAWTKAWCDGELEPFTRSDRVLITRIHMPISKQSHPRNFLEKLRKFSSVVDEPQSLTVVEDYLSALNELMRREATGVYHLVNPGRITLYEIVIQMQKAGLIESERKISKMTRLELDRLTAENGGAHQTYPILNTDKL
ncbi:sugar nucleotide-binding protein, partial [Patescibacteria group bacterium]|nr:sugar nucleotide-binding protein [Patescibacteria group bacterium]